MLRREAAMLDRILHHALVVQIKGDSYRLKNNIRRGACPPQTSNQLAQF